MLRVDGLCTFYGRVSVLKDVNLEVKKGEIVALLGANGAGKTTLLHTLSGLHAPASGSIRFQGEPLDKVKAHLRIALGIAHSPEGRQVFKPLSVEDNLRLGAYRRRDDGIAADVDHVYAMFPVLGQMRRRTASDLSGGQQQMLAIGRALMGKPRLLLLDEPSLGLAPLLIDQIFEVLAKLREQGVTILVVEQNAAAALSIADRGYVLETGRIVHTGTGASLLADPAVRNAYLGI
ncbi:ABC transporter ATP-binding protein [Variovorax sp. Sphag1AA]|uniref:ABC transporter ATP-binding protein n=1 Tax=Variovorax sp. Sphag1AA TaxID=2587027 RepID=UPI00161E00E0|nr:ABC transporter ATP-binding protein [Variovorax sp. Sphag1AA]MBB3180578.1 branched-chain amino acid transport system ATP-binding protein [Variovorax sp. Sphag1AA]